MKSIILAILLCPLATFSQIVKVNVGIAPSLIVAPRTAPGISNTTDNAVLGFAGMVGLDFAETKTGFLSGGIGVIQKGRRDQVPVFDNSGNRRGEKTVKSNLTYGTATFTMNFKLRNDGLIPFFSVGPRVDYLLSGMGSSAYEKVGFGFTGGFGLTRRLENLEFGARLDYHLSFLKQPKTRSGTAMVFFGFPLGK